MLLVPVRSSIRVCVGGASYAQVCKRDHFTLFSSAGAFPLLSRAYSTELSFPANRPEQAGAPSKFTEFGHHRVPTDADERHLCIVPFDGPPRHCLDALWTLSTRKPRWEVWEEVSHRLIKSLKTGHFNFHDVLELLRIFAAAAGSVSGHSGVHPNWSPISDNPHTLEVLQTVLELLVVPTTSDDLASVPELSLLHVQQICRSCSLLKLEVPSQLLDAASLATAATVEDIAADTLVDVFVALLTAPLGLRSPSLKTIAADLQRRARVHEIPAAPLRRLLQTCACHFPVRCHTEHNWHTTIMDAVLYKLSVAPGSLRSAGLPRYLTFLHFCFPSWISAAFCGHNKTSYVGNLRLLLAALDANRKSSKSPSKRRPISSTLEKDVIRVVRGLFRVSGGFGFVEGARLEIQPQTIVGSVFIVDCVLSPVKVHS